MLKITHTIQQRFRSLHPSGHWRISERGSNRGHKRRDNFLGWRAPHRHTPNKYLRSVWFNVWALLGHVHSFRCAQQGKSISPLCIWGGFYLFWSSLRQAGVKIGVCFSSGLLKVHLISLAHGEMMQKKAIQLPVWANTQSSAPKVELKRKEKKKNLR